MIPRRILSQNHVSILLSSGKIVVDKEKERHTEIEIHVCDV